eukprot:9476293-Pyramimonas_sp.AAC.1
MIILSSNIPHPNALYFSFVLPPQQQHLLGPCFMTEPRLSYSLVRALPNRPRPPPALSFTLS